MTTSHLGKSVFVGPHTASRRQWDVDREMCSLPYSPLIGASRVERVETVLVDGDEENAIVLKESLLGAVAVVDVIVCAGRKKR